MEVPYEIIPKAVRIAKRSLPFFLSQTTSWHSEKLAERKKCGSSPHLLLLPPSSSPPFPHFHLFLLPEKKNSKFRENFIEVIQRVFHGLFTQVLFKQPLSEHPLKSAPNPFRFKAIAQGRQRGAADMGFLCK